MRNTKVPFWLNTDLEATNTEWNSAIVTPKKSHKNLEKCLLKLLQYSYIYSVLRWYFSSGMIDPWKEMVGKQAWQEEKKILQNQSN